MPAGEEVTMPAHDRVGPYQQPQALQSGFRQLVEQGRQPGPVDQVKSDPLTVELRYNSAS